MSGMEITALNVIADIRCACGDKGDRMIPELIEYIKQLKADSDELARMKEKKQ